MAKASFPFVQTGAGPAPTSLMPYLPMALRNGPLTVDVLALVDSGSTLNVLPYDIGLKLGLDWSTQSIPVVLSGNLSDSSAFAVVIEGIIAEFPALRLAFAWSSRSDFPTILGQTNFFSAFDVCFSRSKSMLTLAIPSDG